MAVLALVATCGVPALSFSAESESPVARAERIYREAGTEFKASPANVNAAWQFARTCFDFAEFSKTDASRAALAEEGIAACRTAIEHKYSSGPAHYYLAMNLGQLARTKGIGALKLVREMETEFKTAIELDAKCDYAGPHRCLGLLYKDAPDWPTSIGSRSKARFNLRKAVELTPDYPDNRLCLLEAYAEWGEHRMVLDGLPAVGELLQSARKQFAGEEWTLSWTDWESRFAKLKAKADTPVERAVSPRGK